MTIKSIKPLKISLFIIAAVLLFYFGSVWMFSFQPEATISKMYRHLLIGEFFPNGLAYLEPIYFEQFSEEKEIPAFKKEIVAYPLTDLKPSKSFKAGFLKKETALYIPSREQGSRYFLRIFSEPKQPCLVYRSTFGTVKPVTILSGNIYPIRSITYFSNQKKREHTPEEYQKAVESVKSINDSEDTVFYEDTSLKNTIINAVKLCLVEFENSKVKMLVSSYYTQGMEYFADVYVFDFLVNGKAIKTYEKHNWDGPI